MARLRHAPDDADSALQTTPTGLRGTRFPLLVALCFTAGGLYGWSAIIPALRAAFQTTTEAAGLVFSIAIVAFTAAVFTVPRMPPALRDARAASVYGVAGCMCLYVATTAPAFIPFLLAFAVGFGAVSGAIYVICVEAAGRAQRPFVATSIAIAAFGLGGAIFGPGMRFLVGYGAGLGALHLLTAALGVTAAAGLFLTFRTGRGGLAPHVQPVDRPSATSPVVPPVTMILLITTFGAGSFAGLMTLGLATAILDHRDATLFLSSAALFGIAVGNTGGRLSVGWLAPRISPGAVVALAPVVAIVGASIAVATSSSALGAVALVMVASGYGLLASGLPALTRAITGAAGFGRAFSLIFVAWGLAGLLSPWISGRLFDLTGAFTPAYLLAMGTSLVSFLCALALVHRRNS